MPALRLPHCLVRKNTCQTITIPTDMLSLRKAIGKMHPLLSYTFMKKINYVELPLVHYICELYLYSKVEQ